MNRAQGGFLAFVLAILAALGLWNPSPVPPQPTPTPTATQTPATSPTIEPTALPTPSVAPTPSPEDGCVLPPSTGQCVQHPGGRGEFRDVVEKAQAQIPARFFKEDGTVKNEAEYTAAVAKVIRILGYCAVDGQADEVWVKKMNEFSEHWDIVRSDGSPITLRASVCKPAYF